MLHFAPEITSMAEACLGGLRGCAALLIGPERQLQPFKMLLQQMGIKAIYQEETPERLVALLQKVPPHPRVSQQALLRGGALDAARPW